MRKSFRKSQYVLAGILGMIAAFPLVVAEPELHASALSASVTETGALTNYANEAQARADFEKANVLCIQLNQNGRHVNCPDYNDRPGVLAFLRTYGNGQKTASGSTIVTLRVSNLTDAQTNILRRYLRINTCPDALKNFIPGFYELCTSMLNPNPVIYHGFQNPAGIDGLSRQPIFDLNQYINAHKDAHFNR